MSHCVSQEIEILSAVNDILISAGSRDIFEGNHFEFLSRKNMSKRLQHGFVEFINHVPR